MVQDRTFHHIVLIGQIVVCFEATVGAIYCKVPPYKLFGKCSDVIKNVAKNVLT
jgi:hypothetical protein